MLAFSPHLIGGRGILHASSCPRAFCMLKLESRNPVGITEALVLKFLFIVKDITLLGRFLIERFYVYSKQLILTYDITIIYGNSS